MIRRIKTRRGLFERAYLTLLYSAQKSWYPAICIYSIAAVALIIINFEG